MISPHTPEELAGALREAAGRKQSITLGGNFSKRAMAGPSAAGEVTLSTAAMTRVLQYEPRDLTISVEAGQSWRELTRLLEADGQMIPLDPPFHEEATVGGVIAANSSGPRRRLFGTARDLVIGMKFATLEGKLVNSGGMVVKNVAGLDMGKLMIGSFGTLAAIAVVNFKLTPRPEVERSYVLEFATLAQAIAARDKALNSVLQPAAMDLLDPKAAKALGTQGWLLLFRVGGNQAVIERYEREFSTIGGGIAMEGGPQDELWSHVREFTPQYLKGHPAGVVLRASCTLKEVESVMGSFPGPAIARAGSGICHGYFAEPEAAARWMADTLGRGWRVLVDFCPEPARSQWDLWPAPGSDLELMKRIKQMFDPDGLLNRGRLYRLI